MAASRGHVNLCRLLLAAGANKNAVDEDENTALHLTVEAGHMTCIIFLIKEAGIDHTKKNKFGYIAYDVALNFEVRQMLEQLVGGVGGRQSVQLMEQQRNQYGRTAINGVLLHNDRVN